MMEMSTVTEDPHVARRAFLDYRNQVRQPLQERASEAERELREIDREMLDAYRQLAKGVTLIRLAETLAAGGTTEVPIRNWNDAYTTLPRLAVSAAASRHVWTPGVTSNGTVRFGWRRTEARRELSQAAGSCIVVGEAFGELGEHESRGARRTWSHSLYRATVPTVPPRFRPSRIGSYHILFEATWDEEPVPADPALIKHVGGDLWALLHTWDLTPLEAAVLGQR